MNRKTLYRRAQRRTRNSPLDLIRTYRLHKAVDLLRAGYTVTETADLVGLRTSSHFTMVLKDFYK